MENKPFCFAQHPICSQRFHTFILEILLMNVLVYYYIPIFEVNFHSREMNCMYKYNLLKCIICIDCKICIISCPQYFFLSHYSANDVHIVAEVGVLRNQAPYSESWRTQVYYAGRPRS